MAIRQQTAVAVSSTIWLPPLRASLPNVRIVTNKRVTKTSMGTRESKGEGIFVGLCSILNNTYSMCLLCKSNRNAPKCFYYVSDFKNVLMILQ